MAIFRPSALVQNISGSVGGVTFALGPRGSILKHRPARRKTAPEMLIPWNQESSTDTMPAGQILTELKTAWQNLTDTQRLSWRNLAQQLPTRNRLGIRRPLSGFQLFLQEAQLLGTLSASAALVSATPPPPVRAATPTAIDLSQIAVSDADWDIPFTNPTAGSAYKFLYCKTDRTDNPTREIRTHRLLYRRSGSSNQFNNMRSRWEFLFGPPIEGTIVEFSVAVIPYTTGPITPTALKSQRYTERATIGA